MVGGFDVRFCGGTCVWEGVDLCQDFEGCFLGAAYVMPD